MANQTFFQRIKEKIGGICFRVFLWSINMNQEQYIELVYQIEKETRKND